MRTILTSLLAAGLAIGTIGCGEETSTSSNGSASATPASATFLLASAPAGAVDIVSAKQTAKEGDTITVRGKIGGRVEPMSEGSAVFVVMDLSEQSCDELHADRCPTPWDYCCTPPDAIKAKSATVQIVDASGRALEIDLGDAGLSPLDRVVVVGEVGPRPNEDVLIIRATGVYREEG